MKRDPALIPLSRDHHNGLVQAMRLRVLPRTEMLCSACGGQGIREFFRNEERVHLRDEEEELFPLLLRQVPSSLLASARHASNTCSSKGSLASSTSPWRPASWIEGHWRRRERCSTNTSDSTSTALSADRGTRARRRARRLGLAEETRPAPFGARPLRAKRCCSQTYETQPRWPALLQRPPTGAETRSRAGPCAGYCRGDKRPRFAGLSSKADEGTRTLDLLHGKQTL